MSHNLFLGPNAAYNNPPINSNYYTPGIAEIAAITPQSDFSTLIETTEENAFVVGQLVRFIIPQVYGMRQLNEQQAYITSISSDTEFYVQINTLEFDDFIPDASEVMTAFVLPIGDVNSGAINTSGRNNNILYIEGSFRDISPQ